MNTEAILHFWHGHLNIIIGVLVVIVFALVAIYLFIEFIKEKDEVTGEGPSNLKDIETSLKKILESTAVTPKAAASAEGEAVEGADGKATPSAEGGGANPEELEKLQKVLAEKEELITKLEAAKSEDGGGGGGDDELKAKIKEYEARLAEYEIIEDDIADLSMFKEENVRLKDELEKLKSGAAPAADPAPAAEEAPAAPTEAKAPAEEPVAEAAPAEEVPAAEGDDLSDDIMAEFAAAVQDQKATDTVKPIEKAAVEAPAATEEPAAAAEAAPAEPPATEIGEAPAEEAAPAAEPVAEEAPAATEEAPAEMDDVMAEFAAAVEAQKSETGDAAEAAPEVKAAPAEEPAAEPAAAEPEETPAPAEAKKEVPEDPIAEAAAQVDFDAMSLDTDKMLGEVEELNAAAADGGSNADESLSGEVDTDKMLGEVEDLNEAVTPQGDGQVAEQKKMAEEFDNFTKE